jgi:hypothetical protein
VQTAKKSGVLVVPAKAVFVENGETVAYVLGGGKARRRDIVIGIRGVDEVEIKKGLATGEKVLTPLPGKALKNGERVDIQ